MGNLVERIYDALERTVVEGRPATFEWAGTKCMVQPGEEAAAVFEHWYSLWKASRLLEGG